MSTNRFTPSALRRRLRTTRRSLPELLIWCWFAIADNGAAPRSSLVKGLQDTSGFFRWDFRGRRSQLIQPVSVAIYRDQTPAVLPRQLELDANPTNVRVQGA